MIDVADERPAWRQPYLDWLWDRLETKTGRDESDRYTNAAKDLANQFRQHEFWVTFVEKLNAVSAEINDTTPYQLLTVNGYCEPPVVTKSWESILNKSWRINVVRNDEFPNPPALHTPPNEWVTPDNWLVYINDVVRTTIVVRYLDGVHVVRRLLEETATECGVGAPSCRFEARHEGYYAVHSYVTLTLPYRRTTEWEVAPITVEIQTHTQLHEVLRTLTHQHYEERRNRPPVPPEVWTWDDEDPAFVPNFLGHLLQYTDGMIMSLRKRQPVKDELTEE